MQKFVLVPVPFTEEMNQVIDSEYDRYGDHVSAQLAGMMDKVLAAATQPPELGGEIETIGYAGRNGIGGYMHSGNVLDATVKPTKWHQIELADRAHIAQLQAEAEQLTQRYDAVITDRNEVGSALEKAQSRNAELEGLLREAVDLARRNTRSQWSKDIVDSIDAALAGGKEHE